MEPTQPIQVWQLSRMAVRLRALDQVRGRAAGAHCGTNDWPSRRELALLAIANPFGDQVQHFG